MKSKPIPLESEVLKQVLQYLYIRGVFCWRQNQGAMITEGAGSKRRVVRFASVKGISDIVGMTPEGRFVAIEVKRPGRQLEQHQEEFLQRVRDHGGVAGCVHSVEECAALLDAAEEEAG
jgi:hypothetical protein